ncbi:hypothetical protein MTO96_022615 [Rhipicephalus appendiculatus]
MSGHACYPPKCCPYIQRAIKSACLAGHPDEKFITWSVRNHRGGLSRGIRRALNCAPARIGSRNQPSIFAEHAKELPRTGAAAAGDWACSMGVCRIVRTAACMPGPCAGRTRR